MAVKEMKPRFITDKNGKKTHVVIPYPEYEELLKDHNDLVVINDRVNEPKESFETFEKNLKKDGLI